jgi:hypothetical protein
MLESIITEAKKLVNDKIISTFKSEGPKIAFSKLYILLPGTLRLFVKEETFVNFCIANQSILFGNIKNEGSVKKKTVKKSSPKKLAVKKQPKKAVKKF